MNYPDYNGTLYIIVHNNKVPIILFNQVDAKAFVERLCDELEVNNDMYKGLVSDHQSLISCKPGKITTSDLGYRYQRLIIKDDKTEITDRVPFLGFLHFKHGFSDLLNSGFMDDLSNYPMYWDEESLTIAYNAGLGFKDFMKKIVRGYCINTVIDSKSVEIINIANGKRISGSIKALISKIEKGIDILGIDFCETHGSYFIRALDGKTLEYKV